ncbi:MAG: hypothetical protein LBC18_16330 [Opitutaceae bacterium]|jgi:hypothetical protein|nr:hypothetical protein [Opitutaceae bacterium]
MKKLIPLIIIALGLASAAHAADDSKIVAELDQALEKLQKLTILTADGGAYYKQNATGDRNARCDTEKVVATVKGIITKIEGRPVDSIEDIMESMKTRKLVGNPENWRKEFAEKTMKGSHVRSLLIVLTRKIK